MTADFRFPIFVTWFQLVIALICCTVLGFLGKNGVEALSMFPALEYDLNVAKQVFPLAAVFVGMVGFNNLCLLYVEVTFYQVARSSTILFSMIFTYTVLGTKTSLPAMQACAVVMAGFVIGSAGEVRFTWLGVIYGVLSSMFVALYGIFVKKVMPAVGDDQWRLLMYNTINSMILMFPLIWLWGEAEPLFASPAFSEPATWVGLTVTGLVGFMINIAVFLNIKFTSPLTNNIAGTAKACVQSLLAWFIFQNPISPVNLFGIVLTIIGSAWYSSIRYRENQARIAAEKAGTK
jgi:solute carrier family 35 (GDP-fucose transporter), member C1